MQDVSPPVLCSILSDRLVTDVLLVSISIMASSHFASAISARPVNFPDSDPAEVPSERAGGAFFGPAITAARGPHVITDEPEWSTAVIL